MAREQPVSRTNSSLTPAYLKLTVVVLLQGVQHEVEELSLSSRGHALKQSFIHGTCSLCVEVTDVNVTWEPRVLLAQTAVRVSENLVLQLKDDLVAESTDGRLDLSMHTPLTQRCRSGLTMLSWHSKETYQGNERARTSSRKTRPQSSNLAELRTDSGLKSVISSHELISI